MTMWEPLQVHIITHVSWQDLNLRLRTAPRNQRARRIRELRQRMSKAQFVTAVAEKSGLTKKQANAALDAINAVVALELGKKGPGEVILRAFSS